MTPTRPTRRSVLVGLGSAALACGLHPTAIIDPGRSRRARLSVMTYNVLADRVGAPARAAALFALFRRHDPDVVLLQEVAPWFLRAMEDDGVFARRDMARFGRSRAAPGGQYIVSRHPIVEARWRPLPSGQRRTLVVARIDVEGETIEVATTHMESFLSDGPIRAAQLRAIFRELAGTHTAVLAGDFNFGDAEQPESGQLDPAYTDLWPALRAGTPGYTWNIETSPMAAAGSFRGERSRRLDRILVRSRQWRPHAIEIVGDQPLSGDPALFPSDHFGLVGSIARL